MCWDKLDEYYQKYDQSPAYPAAVVLHPGLKWRYFESQWTTPKQQGWLRQTKNRVKAFWEKEYKATGREAARQPYETQRHGRDPDPLAEFVPPPGFYDAQPITAARDEYEEYLRIPAEPCDKPLEWWKAHESQFPVLSRMALDLFSIPLMSAECERVFSAAKNLISDKRNRMKDDIIEVCTVLRHWLKELGKI
jgi:hypothetical protein